MPTFSLIIPVYRVEQYLPQCLDSILQQPFTNFEVILVDDCSPDHSGKLCDDYAAKDSRIKVIHKEQNEGLGYARRDGLAAAAGEWVFFVDSDDWIAPETLNVLSENAGEDMDILVFGMTLCHENAQGETVRSEVVSPAPTQAFTRQEIGNLLPALDTQRSFPYMCNKLYRLQLLTECGVAFNTIQSMEDFFYNIEVFSKARGIRVIPQPFYHYRKPVKETLASAYNPNFFELCKKRNEAEKSFIRQMDAWTEDNLQKLDLIHLNHLIACMIKNTATNSPLSGKEQRQKAKQILADPHTRAMLRHIRCSGLQYRLIVWIFRCRLSLAAVWIGRLANRRKARSAHAAKTGEKREQI